MVTVVDLTRHVERPDGAAQELRRACAVIVSGAISAERCASWTRGVYAARSVWTHDFGGEQFSLGRAFYTHYEEERSGDYFADSKASDARVEAHVPGLQAAMRSLLSEVLGSARVVARRGWCGPGVHVFPPAGPVARRGGVVHFDTEGLTTHHRAERAPALTLVAMLQTAETDGGLRVWDVLYRGHDHPTEEELSAPNAVVAYRTGDVVLIDSYRLHQIQPFDGTRERVSATVHAARLDEGLWECWF
jgi:hypothetical protein